MVFCHNTLLKNILQLRIAKINYYTQRKEKERGKNQEEKRNDKGRSMLPGIHFLI